MTKLILPLLIAVLALVALVQAPATPDVQVAQGPMIDHGGVQVAQGPMIDGGGVHVQVAMGPMIDGGGYQIA